ncbi:amidohydrolase 2 [Microthyrium microscopicum]|uniref:Amidohydrolase 2 n=1 Tax=Microthyrium microscopicum TaxID=703497 RepID=A0A6A6TYD7_9PEZI|nr:amidohydrolase 2 [Microthyrium microscopicum]
MSSKIPLIALEEHFFAPAEIIPTAMNDLYNQQLGTIPNLLAKLNDISASSLRRDGMREAGVVLQIISHGPGLASYEAEVVSKVNDYLASNIKDQGCYRGLAALSLLNGGEEAGKELRRCVESHGFVGALIDNHVVGDDGEPKYYDAPDFDPLWKASEELGKPIYLHPTFPSGSLKDRAQGSYSASAAASISSSGFGWHADVGHHILRLFAAGVFDRFPKLQIIIGHFGEMLPAMVERVVYLSYRWGKRERGFKQVWAENIVVTTSGCWSVDPMATIARNTSVEKVVFSIDWPFAQAEDGRRFWGELVESGIYEKEELEKIGWRNSARLFGIGEEDVLKLAE